MNLVLAVVYPHMCGVGGDFIAMIWKDGELTGLNSSGRLPAAARLDDDNVPLAGITSATVPGAAAGWLALLDRFGSLPLSELTRPAIRLAREGAPRAPGLQRVTSFMRGLLERDAAAARIFLTEGPLVQADLASTLECLDEFYSGSVPQCAPPPFSPQDFAHHRAEWVQPLSTGLADVEVFEMPPNSRGHLALRAIERLEPLDGLSPDEAEFHLRLIRAVEAGDSHGDTVYLCAYDESGMAASLNQSLYQPFGSGVVIPGTGVLLNNRASYFTADDYAGGERPVLTLAPAMALRDGKPRLIFGTMSGDTQIHIHLQLLARIIIAGQELGEAIAAPRWVIREAGLMAEAGLPEIGAQPLPFPDLAGHAHAILVDPQGHLVAAADPRSDGIALGY
jgi:gamma-glutamyltranspeptidase/glutathione hydrolase